MLHKKSVIAGASIAVLSLIGFTLVQQFNRNGADNQNQNPLSKIVTSITPETTVYITDQIPDELYNQLAAFFENHTKYEITETEADISIDFGEGEALYTEYYAPVTSFSSVVDAISLAELENIAAGIEDAHPTFSKIYVLDGSEDDVTSLLNNNSETYTLQTINTMGALIDAATANDIAIIPFDMLDPKLKVLQIDDQNILDDEYLGENWPLQRKLTIEGKQAGKLHEELRNITMVRNNRPIDDMKTVVLTGVTAISRGVEHTITRHGNNPEYPALAVKDVLSQADITHVDNENPLFQGCDPKPEGIVLCGKARSIAALEAIGTDIVDLTGNHQNDYGIEKNLESIELMEDAGFKYFGGGKDKEDAEKVLYMDIGETTIGFVGYNYFDSLNGPGYVSLAKENYPGSNYYSEEKLKRDIEEANTNADIVIVDYQFIENYSYNPLPGQYEVFRQTIEYGADIVVGVQAHQPQYIEFYNDGLIFYGLGNFFFDQMWSYPTRQGIIPRLTFSNGELISVEILTTLLYDYGQPRFTDGAERQELLRQILPPYITPTPTPAAPQ